LSNLPPPDFSAEDLRRLARARLSQKLPDGAFAADAAPKVSDFSLNGPLPDAATLARARPAAVLAPVVARAGGLKVLLTQRASHLRSHSGQVAFPGGKVEPGETARQTALREAKEEIGLDERFVEPLGWLDPYLTGTGFRVAPLLALVDPAYTLDINADEVADAFETPFAFLMDPANHLLQEREWRGATRKFYAMPHGERYIWGATADILRNLYERLFS
jgi:8-oxo-dGTP pyrophosphatase MutT (NUDIX family)